MKEFLKKFKEIYNDPKGKAFLFFGFYFFFFLGLGIFFRSGMTSKTSSDILKEQTVSKRYKNELIMKDNYSYIYKITVDDVDYVYRGKRNNNSESFSYLNRNYYKSGNYCFCQNSTWEECENPYLYPEYLDTALLFSLIDSSYFESITSYESGKNSIHYNISGSLIDKVVYHENKDYADDGNSIVVNTLEDDEVNQIFLNLDSYGIINGICKKNFRLSFEYDEFGQIPKIVNPMD